MRYLLVVIIGIVGWTSVQAAERAFGLDGSVYQLNDDNTWVHLPPAATEGRINFHFAAAQNMSNDKCQLQLVLTNATDKSVRYLIHRFMIFTRREHAQLGFGFGGGMPSEAIDPGETAEAAALFTGGACDKITEIETFVGYRGHDPSELHVDGLSAFDVGKLLHYPDIGIFTIRIGK